MIRAAILVAARVVAFGAGLAVCASVAGAGGAWAATTGAPGEPSTGGAAHEAEPKRPGRDADPPGGGRYYGAYIGPVVGGGPSLGTRPGALQGGGLLHVGGRLSLPFNVVEAEVAWEHTRLAGGDGSLRSDELLVQVGGHPLFPYIIYNNPLGWLLSGLHGTAAVGPAHVRLRGAELQASWGRADRGRSMWGLAAHLGGGLDYPLAGAQRPSGWWLTMRYGVRFLAAGPRRDRITSRDHRALVLIGWRHHSLDFARVPRPFSTD